ncbi:MAG: hypothetical protein KDI79_29795 [Anaerolineae bacterium]|nr:hypothetical protein [Anaerolineae bacterium]
MSDRQSLSNINRDYVVQELERSEIFARLFSRFFRFVTPETLAPPNPISRPNLNILEPISCRICGYLHTLSVQYAGHRCVDPGHWQAAGLISFKDYYSLAKIAAEARKELHHRQTHPQTQSLCPPISPANGAADVDVDLASGSE